MLMGRLWVACACLQVSLMASSMFLMQLPQGILLVPYGFLWQGYFLKCVTSICFVCVSFSKPLYLFSWLAFVYRWLRSCCTYLLCVAHELHTSALWCSCSLPELVHGAPSGCAMWPFCWVNVNFMRIVYWFHVEVLWVSFLLPLGMLWLSYAFPMFSYVIL